MRKQIDDNNNDGNPEILLVILVRSTNNRDSRINTRGNRVWLGNCRWLGNWRPKRTNPQSYHHPNRCCQRDPLEVAESSIWWRTDGRFPTFGSKSRLGSQLCRRPSNNPTISSSRTEIGLRSKKTIPVLMLSLASQRVREPLGLRDNLKEGNKEVKNRLRTDHYQLIFNLISQSSYLLFSRDNAALWRHKFRGSERRVICQMPDSESTERR